jgi:low affinity Fe/Cu permease
MGSFDRFAKVSADAIGASWMFVLGLIGCGVWFITGPMLGWSDTWQLIINTPTTVLTFLWVILIQNTQNRHQREMTAILRQIAKDLPAVDENAAKRRAKAMEQDDEEWN